MVLPHGKTFSLQFPDGEVKKMRVRIQQASEMVNGRIVSYELPIANVLFSGANIQLHIADLGLRLRVDPEGKPLWE